MASKARISRVKEAWLGLPESWRTNLASAWHTFIPAFIGAILLSPLIVGDGSITLDAAAALVLTAVRAGFKAISVWFFSRTLPDPKDE